LEARSGEGLGLQLPRIASAFGDLIDRARVKRTGCGAVSFGFPAIVDSSTGRVLTAYGKYVDASTIDLQKWARGAFGLDLVIENDARAALVGEWRAGAAKGCDNVVGITLGTGLGAAAIMKGQPVRGMHGQAGILGGHFTVRWGGRLCTCGNRGCAEAEASTSVLQ
jgi:glucokinase